MSPHSFCLHLQLILFSFRFSLTFCQFCCCLLFYCITVCISPLIDFCFQSLLLNSNLLLTQFCFPLCFRNLGIDCGSLNCLFLFLALNLIGSISFCLLRVRLLLKLCLFDGKLVILLSNLCLSLNSSIIGSFVCFCLSNGNISIRLSLGNRCIFLNF